MNLTCWLAERRWSARMTRGESPTPDSWLSRHLESCPRCQAMARELVALGRTLPVLALPSAFVDFDERVLSRLSAAPPLSTRPRRWQPATALVLCGAATVALGFWASGTRPTPVRRVAASVARPAPTSSPAPRTLPRSVARQKSALEGFREDIPTVAKSATDFQQGVRPEAAASGSFPQRVRTRSTTGGSLRRDVPTMAKSVGSVVGDDLTYVNGAGFDDYALRASALLRKDSRSLLEALPQGSRRDDFVQTLPPQLATTSPSAMAEALARYEQEKSMVDARLQHRITLGMKRVSFSDLCEKLAKESGIEIVASRGVAEEKLTVFCKDKPLRDLIRQITRHFGFVWERSGTEENFRYKLIEPLKVRILEEELRNKDRNEALLALDREMDAFKDLLGLSPEQARELEENTLDETKKKRYGLLGGIGWGPARLYGGLSSDERDALMSGKRLHFQGDGDGSGGALPLPSELRDTILKSLRGHAFIDGNSTSLTSDRDSDFAKTAKGLSPDQVPGYAPSSALSLQRSELGEFELVGYTGFGNGSSSSSSGTLLAKGVSPSAASPENAKANAGKKNQPALQRRVAGLQAAGVGEQGKERITTADLLEAIHKATGKDVLGDYFTRLYDKSKLLGKNEATLFDLLNRSCDAARLRWDEAEGFLTFRSTDFFNMRLKEVPNRLLDRWVMLRKEKKALTSDELREISRLTDFQLDASGMAEGAALLWKLEEWEDVRAENLRPAWRFLDALPAPQRAAMIGESGLTFGQLGLDARQKFLALAYYDGEGVRKAVEEGTADEETLRRLMLATLRLTFLPDPNQTAGKNPPEWRFLARLPEKEGRTLLREKSRTSTSSSTDG